MSGSYHRGHPITFDYMIGEWRYTDGVMVKDEDRPCTNCQKESVNGHDACIVSLPGIKAACCGYGVREGYLLFEDDRHLKLSCRQPLLCEKDKQRYR